MRQTFVTSFELCWLKDYTFLFHPNDSQALRYPLADRTVPLKRSYRGIVFRKMRKVSRWVNPGAHAGAGQPASSRVIALSHCPQIPCWAPCWAIIVKMRYSSCQQRLSTDFRNVSASKSELTHWGRAIPICVSKLCHHWYKWWIVVCSALSHYLNQRF